ncbi:hypothetical protein PIROE2DRAFT_7556 [Piromyces sp. E2]|nr:hypothetical protein PIROE2DRAFT_7556 [Piromyces sp. E2]|eukprot:OUM65441.1 hypothetical protein PIROE2DRAFT_7556 [Piromyces sp. E2]
MLEILKFVDLRIKEINNESVPQRKNYIPEIKPTDKTEDKNDKKINETEKENKVAEVFKYTNIPYSIKSTNKIKNTPEIFYNILESDEYIAGPKTDFENSIREKIDMPNIYPLFINPVSSTYNPYWKNGLDSKMALMDPETVALLTKEIPSNKYIKQIKSFQKMQTREKKKYIKDIKKNEKMKSKGQIMMFFNKAEEILNKRNEKKKEEEMAKTEEKEKFIKEQEEKEKTYGEIENEIMNRVTSNNSSTTDNQDFGKSQSSLINLNFNEEQYDINSTSILNLIHDQNNYDTNSYSDIEESTSDIDSESSENVNDDDDEYNDDNASDMVFDEYLNDDEENEN